jgi:formylglycine-generating enzyme required for sulfatase activity
MGMQDRSGQILGWLAAIGLTGALSMAAVWYFFFSESAEPLPRPADAYVVNAIGLKLVLIPAGEFRMGSSTSEAFRNEDELLHDVTIARPFYLGIYEVTQAQYQKVVGTNPSWFVAGRENTRLRTKDTSHHPVDSVTWNEAAAFCAKLSDLPEEKKAARFYRLPTEAEWEYACRAGTTTVFHYGDNLDSEKANFNGLSPYGQDRRGPFLRTTCKVAEYKPNALGLYDMHGNVQEWCADWYAADYYAKSPKENPQGPDSGSERVVRGGSWVTSANLSRSAARNKLAPEEATYVVGFRVVMEAK